MLAHRQRCIDELLSLVQRGKAARIRTAEDLSKDGSLAEVISVWQTWWRDVVLVRSGCQELVVNLEYSDALNRFAGHCDLAEAEAHVRDTESALQRLDQNVNARLALEVLLLGWPQVAELVEPGRGGEDSIDAYSLWSQVQGKRQGILLLSR